MQRILPWVMMPTKWVLDGRLKRLAWGKDFGSNNLAALIVLAPLLHKMDRTSGESHITYNELERATSLSRHKISDGLEVLKQLEIISESESGRSHYQIADFDPSLNWAKFPGSKLYREGRISFFDELHLRKRVELDAMKLWYFFSVRRDNDVNLAKVTYDQISDGTGIPRDRLKSGVSFLAANSLVHVEHIPSRHSEYGVANAYRLPQIDASRHMGTVGRSITEFDAF